GHGAELEDRVDRHQLDAGSVVELAGGDSRERRLHSALAACIAVVYRVAEQSPVAVAEREVDSPRVDADRVDAVSCLARREPEPVEDAVVEPEDVPVERSVRAHRDVREAVQLGDREPLAVEDTERDATTLRSQVHGRHCRHYAVLVDARAGRRPRSCSAPRPPSSGSTATTSTPRALQERTSSGGAPVSVTIASTRSVGTNDRSALRCHFVASKMPITRSQAAAISCFSRTSSGLRSMRPRSRLRPLAPKNPRSICVVRSTSALRCPTTDIEGSRSIPPVTSTFTPGESTSAAAIRRPFVTTTSSCLVLSSRAR